ncbi:hypothetical protein SUGI_1027580 [Cryptomeria japonica]|nr:hypothetical protein SUGI_1027580 [Cryptomeria japonica]
MAKTTSPSVTVKYTKLFINGEFVDSVSGRSFETFDPRTGDSITSVAEAGKEDVDVAVKAARNAFDHGPWPRMSGYERGIKGLRYYAGWADKIHGLTLKMSGAYQGYTLQEPIGVVGQIITYNAALMMFLSKISPALACGCTIVIKSAEQTPLTALYAAQLAKEAGIPPGVLNVLSGFGETAGAAMSSHMDIDKISFAGSTKVGKLIMEAAAKSNLKPVILELGGKSPLIIMDDANIEEAIKIAHTAVYTNAGQVCTAGSRLFVQEGIYDEFVKKVVERAKRQVVGDPFLPGVQHGP